MVSELNNVQIYRVSSLECEFYQMVRGMKGCPIPEIYVAEKYTDKG